MISSNMIKTRLVLLLLIVGWHLPLCAQWEKTESVLKDHAWYKIGVVEEGIYGLGVADLQALGVETQSVDPSKIRLFGNVQSMLPEANAASRYDDLNEISIQITGDEDGTFNGNDRIIFFGQGPLTKIWTNKGYYQCERNTYSDTVFYFLCLEGNENGLRVTDKPVVTTSESDAVITQYPDCFYHENEEISPFASGRTWYGDMFTSLEGSKEFELDIPDLVTTKVIHMFSRVLGRCPSRFSYNLWMNNNLLVDHVDIAKSSDLNFGHEHDFNNGMCFVDSEHLSIRYEINPVSENALLYLDYFVINCWRELVFHGDMLAFGLVPSQIETPVARVRVNGAGSTASCWDVTDPIHPKKQVMDHQLGFSTFGIDSHEEQRYQVFNPSSARTVASCYPIPNQNLHAISNAELLIISPRLFWETSNAFADFHLEQDDMDCVVADVEEIYNEFGTGMADPTAVRDFIRMVYLRSGRKLKYVMLMGKGTHDYRDIKGFGNNFVPTYEILEKPWYEVASMCSDDYFALMDTNEGEKCTGYVDIGVGRLPITTPEQGEALLEKVKHYADLSSTHGDWKNNHLFLVDNDARSYMDYTEDLEKILDTVYPIVTVKKLYTDSYPIVNTPSGKRVPEAHDVLMDYFDQGVGVVSYTGHGGVRGLMEELILTNSDILAMNNYDRLPFVHTATCEFSKFDNPSLVSAGELLFLNPHGGAIAMLTTVRPTLGTNNQKVSKSFHKHLYSQRNRQSLRFGDIVRSTKADPKYYSSSNIGFVLFGDPALRISTPVLRVVTQKINGVSENPAVTAGSLVTVEGCVFSSEGKIDTLFNGELSVCLYDKRTKYTTLGNFVNPRDYTYYNDVLFKGKATVRDGQFTVKMQVPLDVNYWEGNARLSYYAYDSLRQMDATGVFDDLALTGADSLTVFDHQGPDIHLYWNTPDFVSGDQVSRNGILYADLFDEQGIYHYNVCIGRNILLNSTLAEYDNMLLNSWFEPAMDDYRKGRIAIPVKELDDGTYGFKLKAWDTQNNPSEVEISFVIKEGIMLADVSNYPNPFQGETRFSFVHGDKTENLSVRIEVYDMMGRCVADINQQTAATGGVVPPLVWDGRGSHGQRLKAGIYVYRLSVTDSQGKTRTVSKRLVIG